MSNYVVIGGCGGANSEGGSSEPVSAAGEIKIFKNNMVPADYQKMSPIIDALAQPNYVDASFKKGNFLQSITGEAAFGYDYATFTDRGFLSSFLCSYQSVKSNKVGACAAYDYLTAVMRIENGSSAQSTLAGTTLRLKIFGTKYSDGSHTLIASALNISCESFEISDDGNFIYFASYHSASGTYFVKMSLVNGAVTQLANIPTKCSNTYIKRLNSNELILVSRVAGDATTRLDSVIYKYDISLNTFTLLATRPSSRVSGHTILVNDKVYIFGGTTKDQMISGVGYGADDPRRSIAINNFDIYDITNNTWTQKTLPYNLRGSNGPHYKGGVMLLPNNIIVFVKDSEHNLNVTSSGLSTPTLQFAFYSILSDSFTYSEMMRVNNMLRIGDGGQSGFFGFGAYYIQTCSAGGLFLDKDGALCFFVGSSNQPYIYTSKVYEDFSNNNVAAYKKSV